MKVLKLAPRLLPVSRATAAAVAPLRGMLPPLLFAAALLMIWQLMHSFGVLNPFLLPPPDQITQRILHLTSAESLPPYVLIADLAGSAVRVATGFASALVIGVPVGLLLGLSARARLALGPLISFLMPIPALAWGPIFILVFGFGAVTTTLITFMAAVFVLIYNARLGVEGVDERWLWALRSLGGSHLQELRRVIVPASIPAIVTGMRTGVSYAWRALIAAEMFGGVSTGLGFRISYARESMDTLTIYAGIGAIALLGLLIDRVAMVPLERYVAVRWYGNG